MDKLRSVCSEWVCLFICLCTYTRVCVCVSLRVDNVLKFCFASVPIASYEGPSRREEISLSKMWLQMQVGNSAEVPHDKAYR